MDVKLRTPKKEKKQEIQRNLNHSSHSVPVIANEKRDVLNEKKEMIAAAPKREEKKETVGVVVKKEEKKETIVAKKEEKKEPVRVAIKKEEKKELNDTFGSRFTRFTEDASKGLLALFDTNEHTEKEAAKEMEELLPNVPSRQGNASYVLSKRDEEEKKQEVEDVEEYDEGYEEEEEEEEEVELEEKKEETQSKERKRDKLRRLASNLNQK
jgi:hypothetical protein